MPQPRKYFVLIEKATGSVVRCADITDQPRKYHVCLILGWQFDVTKYVSKQVIQDDPPQVMTTKH